MCHGLFIFPPLPTAVSAEPPAVDLTLRYALQSLWDRASNLLTSIMYTELAANPALKDMRALCTAHKLSPPELQRGHSAAAASIMVTDWAWEPSQPMPPSVHVLALFCMSMHEDHRPCAQTALLPSNSDCWDVATMNCSATLLCPESFVPMPACCRTRKAVKRRPACAACLCACTSAAYLIWVLRMYAKCAAQLNHP